MKYDVGFRFYGMPTDHMCEEYLISCFIKGRDTNSGAYFIEWVQVNAALGTAEYGTWRASEKSIDDYIIGYTLWNTPLVKALNENR